MSKFCSQCGNEVEDNVAFCNKCGNPIELNNTNNMNPNNYNNTYNNNYNTMGNINSKSKVAAGLLGIFLGAFGIHNFYLGYTGKGVAQLLITLLSCFIFSFVSAIWGFIEGIIILTSPDYRDANGNPLV